jgi:hypothetical protein
MPSMQVSEHLIDTPSSDINCVLIVSRAEKGSALKRCKMARWSLDCDEIDIDNLCMKYFGTCLGRCTQILISGSSQE